MDEIEKDMPWPVGREGVTVETYPSGSSQFGVQPVVLQEHGIITRSGLFLSMAECRSIGFLVETDGPAHGLDKDVTVVGHPGATEVGVRKTIDAIVAVMVSAATVPSFQTGVRTELHHSEWACRTGKGVSVASGTDERVDKLGVPRLCRGEDG